MSASIEVRHSTIHGTGVFATANLPKGQEVVYYAGKLMTHEEADVAEGNDVDTGHTFLFTLNDRYVIEGGIDGNEARWINHSCDPNCEALLVESEDGDPAHDRIVIETIRPIRAGEELTYDYGITTDEPLTSELRRLWTCRCGAAACNGLILSAETP
jgi:SET domain-containing protein